MRLKKRDLETNKKTILKDWGWEEIFADNNGMYRGKVLHINKGHGFHLQRHHKKDETQFIYEGRGILKTEDSDIEVESGDTFRFKPGTIHKIFATEDMTIFEVCNNVGDEDVEHLE